MAKYIKLILVFSILSSCYTRKGCEQFCKTDSVRVVIHDTIITDSIHTDTVFKADIDTVVLTKENLTIKYIKVKDKIYLSGTVKPDTIYRTKTVYYTVKEPIKSTFSKVLDLKWWIVLAFLIGFFLCFFTKRA